MSSDAKSRLVASAEKIGGKRVSLGMRDSYSGSRGKDHVNESFIPSFSNP